MADPVSEFYNCSQLIEKIKDEKCVIIQPTKHTKQTK
jgi:hypothetical protein